MGNNSNSNNWGPNTKFIHAGAEPDPSTGAIMTPIYQTSTYVQEAPGKNKGFEYARSQNPTRKALEDALAIIENGKFALAFGSGVAATDWSWAPLWVDFDNDGLKDLFISNGIPKRMNDIDYINFVTNGDIQQMIRNNSMEEKDYALINKFPEIKLPICRLVAVAS